MLRYITKCKISCIRSSLTCHFCLPDLTDLYNSKVSGVQSAQAERQSSVLYVLTFVTIIIAPLQLLTGVYGMNFDVMPELHWEYGYLYFWSMAIGLMLLLGLYFVRMGWLEDLPGR